MRIYCTQTCLYHNECFGIILDYTTIIETDWKCERLTSLVNVTTPCNNLQQVMYVQHQTSEQQTRHMQLKVKKPRCVGNQQAKHSAMMVALTFVQCCFNVASVLKPILKQH